MIDFSDKNSISQLFKMIKSSMDDPKNAEYYKKSFEEKLDIIYEIAKKELNSRKKEE